MIRELQIYTLLDLCKSNITIQCRLVKRSSDYFTVHFHAKSQRNIYSNLLEKQFPSWQKVHKPARKENNKLFSPLRTLIFVHCDIARNHF